MKDCCRSFESPVCETAINSNNFYSNKSTNIMTNDGCLHIYVPVSVLVIQYFFFVMTKA